MIETRRLKNAVIFIQITYIYASAQPEIFQGREGFMKLGHFDKVSSELQREKAPQVKILEVFYPRCS